MNPARFIRAGHLDSARRESADRARDDYWRMVDRRNASTPPSEPAPAAPAAQPAPAAPAAPKVPPGHLLLSPEEVGALGHLLDSHPATRRDR